MYQQHWTRNAVRRSFSPWDVPETVAWFSARHGITNASGAASAWATLSPAGTFTGSQASAPARPTVATGINGRPSLAFASASSQELVNTTTNILTGSPATYVLAVAQSATAGGGTLFCFRSSTSGGRVWVCQASTSGINRNYVTDGVSNSSSAVLALEPSITAAPFLVEYELTTGAVPVVRIDGAARTIAGAMNAAGMAGATGFHIGGREAAGGEKWNGDIADIYIASGIPSAANKAKLRTHFSLINGMTLL